MRTNARSGGKYSAFLFRPESYGCRAFPVDAKMALLFF